ncbi:diaminopimelate decarboxylase family protein [Actinosynnema sp. NPDC053489]|uniref:diaminopimelate decarboxylase family protein n=1 Tax=Actinosynnema sp. NPDC053489 TaxID=3363916 RepID=UPI0037CC226E
MQDDVIASAVREFGTPCYLYDEALIRRNAARFGALDYPSRSVHFASMANNNPELLRLVHGLGLGIFVNSVRHLKLALDCGFGPEEIIYTSTGVRRSDLEFIADLGVHVNLDSVGQLRLFGEIAPGRSCGIRLNIDENSLGNVFIGAESRIGVLETEIPEVLEIAARYDLKLIGTHVYLGTNIVSLDTMIAGVERTLQLSNHFADLAYVDLGGGFPVPEEGVPEFDYPEYNRRITDLFTRYSAERGREIRLVLEPGRAMFGDTAVFCTEVLDVKDRPDRRLACVDASASLMPRSLFYGEFNAVDVLGRAGDPVEDKPTDVVGSTTYSRDFLAKGAKLPAAKVGDVLVFRNTGSYGYSMMTQFLGQDAPTEVLVAADGTARVIRERGGARP